MKVADTFEIAFAAPSTRRREIFAVRLAHDVREKCLEFSAACLHESHAEPIVEVQPRHRIDGRMRARRVFSHGQLSRSPDPQGVAITAPSAVVTAAQIERARFFDSQTPRTSGMSASSLVNAVSMR